MTPDPRRSAHPDVGEPDFDTATTELGGACAVLMGLAVLLAGVALQLDPSRKTPFFWESILLFPTWYLVTCGAMAAVAVLALAVVPAIEQLLASAHRGWALWLSKIGYISFFALALHSAQSAAAVDVLYSPIDPGGVLWIAGAGVWAFGIHWMAWRARLWPRRIARWGLTSGIVASCVPLFLMLGIGYVSEVLIGLGTLVLFPAWLVGLGLHLRRI